MTLGEELKRLRSLKNLTQKQLAEMVGVKQPAIANIESGISGLSLDVMINLCVLFNLPMDHFAKFVRADLAVPPPSRATIIPVDLPPTYNYQLLGTVGASSFDKPDVYDPPRVFESYTKYPRDCFTLKVVGDSCQSAGIPNGATIVVRPTTELPDKRFVVVANEEGYALKLYSDGVLWQFHPGDTEPTIVDSSASTRIVGYVVGGAFDEPEIDVNELTRRMNKRKRKGGK